jgi:hypothetical protein
MAGSQTIEREDHPIHKSTRVKDHLLESETTGPLKYALAPEFNNELHGTRQAHFTTTGPIDSAIEYLSQ